jgi:hypothetical protein
LGAIAPSTSFDCNAVLEKLRFFRNLPAVESRSPSAIAKSRGPCKLFAAALQEARNTAATHWRRIRISDPVAGRPCRNQCVAGRRLAAWRVTI